MLLLLQILMSVWKQLYISWNSAMKILLASILRVVLSVPALQDTLLLMGLVKVSLRTEFSCSSL